MAVRTKMFYTLVNALPNPTLMTIGAFKLKSFHIAIGVILLLSYIAVKKLGKIIKPSDTDSNLFGIVSNLFIPIALIVIIVIALIK